MLRLEANLPEAFCNLGNALKSQGKHDEAIANIRHALLLKPDLAEAHNNLGNVFKDQGKVDLAIASYRDAIRLKPDYAEAHNNLGLALTELDSASTRGSPASKRPFVCPQPERPERTTNLGSSSWPTSGSMERGIACLEEAIRLQPDHAEAHYNQAMRLLLLGRFAEGWEEYESGAGGLGNLLAKISPRLLTTAYCFWDAVPAIARTDHSSFPGAGTRRYSPVRALCVRSETTRVRAKVLKAVGCPP